MIFIAMLELVLVVLLILPVVWLLGWGITRGKPQQYRHICRTWTRRHGWGVRRSSGYEGSSSIEEGSASRGNVPARRTSIDGLFVSRPDSVVEQQ